MKSSKRSDPFCQICGRKKNQVDLVEGHLVRPVVEDLIRQVHPGWSEQGYICVDDLNRFRYDYVRSLVEAEKGELSDLDKEVLDSITHQEIISANMDQAFDARLTFGERLSDTISRFGGSWTFIIFFAIVLLIWIVGNSSAGQAKSFDPYPYILLNLVLSCLAAIQAPIIMMSQNRLEAKDRTRATHDYQVNLKAELEIRQIHQKLDHLLSHQWERLVEIQEIQLELLSEMRSLSTNHQGVKRGTSPAVEPFSPPSEVRPDADKEKNTGGGKESKSLTTSDRQEP